MSWAMSSTCFLRSAISASRIASWNWLWKSAAMLRTRRVHCPSVRKTAGSSFGPITISATTPMSRNSVQEMSNMEILGPAKPADPRQVLGGLPAGPQGRLGHLAFGLGASFDVTGLQMIDRLHRRIGLRRFGGPFIGIRHALPEGFDALGDVAHHVRNLAAAAEHQQQDTADDQPMPDTKGTHETLRAQLRPRPPWDREFSLKLGVEGGKNKLNRVDR